MKIIIFGSTGTIGQQLVKQALECGHHVTAFTRNPAKFAHLTHPHLTPYQG
ncbi:MAG: NAD(P)H-binding protein, partial [Chitinophagales bacterium]